MVLIVLQTIWRLRVLKILSSQSRLHDWGRCLFHGITSTWANLQRFWVPATLMPLMCVSCRQPELGSCFLFSSWSTQHSISLFGNQIFIHNIHIRRYCNYCRTTTTIKWCVWKTLSTTHSGTILGTTGSCTRWFWLYDFCQSQFWGIDVASGGTLFSVDYLRRIGRIST
jgi:hypothetical protein